MGADCRVCGRDMIDKCHWCELKAERDRLQTQVDDALARLERGGAFVKVDLLAILGGDEHRGGC